MFRKKAIDTLVLLIKKIQNSYIHGTVEVEINGKPAKLKVKPSRHIKQLSSLYIEEQCTIIVDNIIKECHIKT